MSRAKSLLRFGSIGSLVLVAAASAFVLGGNVRSTEHSSLLLAEQRAHRETAARADAALRRALASDRALQSVLIQHKNRAGAGLGSASEKMPAPGAAEPYTRPAVQDEPATVESDAALHDGLAAFDDAQRLVKDALGRALWTQQDANAMSSLSSKMAAEQRREIVDRLVASLNTDQLRLANDLDAPFF